MKPSLSILGTRGIPAQYGGFETFAERLAIYLQKRGWVVTVYCQTKGTDEIYHDLWKGIKLIHIPVNRDDALGTIVFDWKSTSHASNTKNLILTLGYNTAFLCAIYRIKRLNNIINMDGIEWRRGKWNFFERAWLYTNEKLGAWLGNYLIADHPEIKKHLSRFVSPKKIATIPYGADILQSADEENIAQYGIQKNCYALLIARAEKENLILEIVRAYSRTTRGIPLVILGDYNKEKNCYHKQVINAAGKEVIFLGAIYDTKTVESLRYFARFYLHGHTVGGTNPSLVEALGAGSAILANDNKFNRWVAGEEALYFSTEKECSRKISKLLEDDELVLNMKKASYQQIQNYFTWNDCLSAYEEILFAEALQKE